MRLIIDIDDEMVCNDIKNKALEPTSETDEVIINALYNGTPYNPSGDLISRSELKKCAIPCQIHNGALTDLCVPLYQIDNAPTVNFSLIADFQRLTAVEKKEFVDLWNNGMITPDVLQGWKYEERPHGEWLHPYITDIACECSNCHLQLPITDYFNFCPNCGADMRKVVRNEQ